MNAKTQATLAALSVISGMPIGFGPAKPEKYPGQREGRNKGAWKGDGVEPTGRKGRKTPRLGERP